MGPTGFPAAPIHRQTDRRQPVFPKPKKRPSDPLKVIAEPWGALSHPRSSSPEGAQLLWYPAHERLSGTRGSGDGWSILQGRRRLHQGLQKIKNKKIRTNFVRKGRVGVVFISLPAYTVHRVLPLFFKSVRASPVSSSIPPALGSTALVALGKCRVPRETRVDSAVDRGFCCCCLCFS